MVCQEMFWFTWPVLSFGVEVENHTLGKNTSIIKEYGYAIEMLQNNIHLFYIVLHLSSIGGNTLFLWDKKTPEKQTDVGLYLEVKQQWTFPIQHLSCFQIINNTIPLNSLQLFSANRKQKMIRNSPIDHFSFRRLSARLCTSRIS